MRIIVTGDRSWNAIDVVEGVLTRLLVRYGPSLVIVHGGATGIDATFREACDVMEVEQGPHPADWRIGLNAGPVRNQAIINAGAGLCLAYHRAISASKKVKDCAGRAIEAGIPTYLINSDAAEPKQLLAGVRG